MGLAKGNDLLKEVVRVRVRIGACSARVVEEKGR